MAKARERPEHAVHALPELPTALSPSLLFLIVDLHPLAWSILADTPPPAAPNEHVGNALSKAQPTALSITDFINVLLVFLNAHLAARWGNQVVVYGASAGRSRLLYPPPTDPGPSVPKPNMYHPFNLLDNRFEEGIKGMAQQEQERLDAGQVRLNDQPAIVSALTKALCYINRVIPSTTNEAETMSGPDKIETRIMIINATPSSAPLADKDAIETGGGDMRGGYVGLMNCVFAAQKAKVPIDVLSLPPPSGGSGPPIFLQQASHLTEGVYWRWNGRGGLLQYLHSIYLAPPALRHMPFAVPPQDAVDFRAVCFCHHDVVDVGFVCSVCLSIFCKPLNACQMCKTKFPVRAIPGLRAQVAGIMPIPIPNTIPPPSGNGGKQPPQRQAGDPKDVIQVD